MSAQGEIEILPGVKSGPLFKTRDEYEKFYWDFVEHMDAFFNAERKRKREVLEASRENK